MAASFAAAAAKDDKEAKQATNGKSTDAGKAEGSIPKAPFVAPAGVDPVAVPAFPPAMTGFMQGAKFPLPQVGANPFAPAAGFPPMAVPPPQSGPAGAQPGVAGTAQWNAMLQYYAYYSYLLCNGATGAAPADGAAPPRLHANPSTSQTAPLFFGEAVHRGFFERAGARLGSSALSSPATPRFFGVHCGAASPR